MRHGILVLLLFAIDWTLLGGRITTGLGQAVALLMDEDVRGALRHYTIEPFFGR